MMNDVVSICLPVYNSEDTIEETLYTLFQQDYNNVEIIIVNDGSTDSTLDIISELCLEKKNIQIKTTKNSGVAAARNEAISLATGKYICFMDSDDKINSNYISSMVSSINSSKADICIASFNEVTFKDKDMIREVSHILPNNIVSWKESSELFAEMLINGYFHPCWGKLFRSDIIKRFDIQFPKLSLSEDSYFVLEYLKHSNTIVTLDSILYQYCHYEEKIGLSKKLPDNMFMVYIDLHCKYLELCKKMKDSRVNYAVNKMMYAQYYSVVQKVFENNAMDWNFKKKYFLDMFKHELIRKCFKMKNSSITMNCINRLMLAKQYRLAYLLYEIKK